jgi:hypothetical protein
MFPKIIFQENVKQRRYNHIYFDWLTITDSYLFLVYLMTF